MKKKCLKIIRRVALVLISIVLVFSISIFGYWVYRNKLSKFDYCINPNNLWVREYENYGDKIRISAQPNTTSLYSGYYYEIEDTTLKIGFKYGIIFGEHCDFDITIDLEGECIDEVILVGAGDPLVKVPIEERLQEN